MRSPWIYARGAVIGAAGFLLFARPAVALQIGIDCSGPQSCRGIGEISPPPDALTILLDPARADALSPKSLAIEFPGSASADDLAASLRRHADLDAVVFDVSPPADGVASDAGLALTLDIKKKISLARGLQNTVRVALRTTGGQPLDARNRLVIALLADSTIAVGVDALMLSAGDPAPAMPEDERRPEIWRLAGSSDLVTGVRLARDSSVKRVFFPPEAFPSIGVLGRLARAMTPDVSAAVSPLYRPAEGSRISAESLLDGKTLSPILLLEASSPASSADIPLTPGAYREADVTNLGSGASRIFPIDAKSSGLRLDVGAEPLLVTFRTVQRPGATTSSVNVSATHDLTAAEIIARERAWQAAMDDRIRTFSADLSTSLRFRIAEVNETFDLTIDGPLFKDRGKDYDWVWKEFHINGIKWKGHTLPKIPLLQPEKVTTLPLSIELTEDYDYRLDGKSKLGDRTVYEIDFSPKVSAGAKPLYRGRAWIDTITFALVKRRSVQVNLKGETLSNIETEFFKHVPGDPESVLPLEIKGEEVFSTAGRTTAIERSVELKNVIVNPPDFEARRKEAYASESQMVRDTDHGLKYLVPDPAKPGSRIVEEKTSKRSLFGVTGFFADGSLSYPIPLLGIQYFDFDFLNKNKQISVFFAGPILTANYTDPSFAGSRFDVGADVFGFAIPFTDTAYSGGKEVESDRLKHIPEIVQVNVGHPLGPYVKLSVSGFMKYDDYQRDDDTAPDFITPADTETIGGEAKATINAAGVNTILDYSYYHRADWTFWGVPGASEYSPSQQNYDKYYASVSKDYYFSNFRKLHAALGYYSGSDLDRFSSYEFGSFSGNPIRGFNSGSLRADQAWVFNLSYGLNIENIIRLEGLYDQAIVTDRVSGFNHDYVSGAGISGQLNGPWNNSLIRFDVGLPVVSRGIHGYSASLLLLKLF